jgi:hypothetical protein
MVVRPVENVRSRRLCKQLVEIIKKKVPKATDFDFHNCVIFHQAAAFFLFWFFFLSSPPLENIFALGSLIGGDRRWGRAWVSLVLRISASSDCKTPFAS